MPYRKHFSFAIQRFRLLYSQAVYHRLLLLHCSNQILHHSLHRLNLIGTVSITAAEQQGIIQRSLCRIGQSFGNAVRDISRITMLQTLVTVADLCFFPTLFHGRDLLQERIYNGTPRHAYRTLGDDNIFCLRVDVGLLVALRCVTLLSGDKTGCHLHGVRAKLHGSTSSRV